MMPLSIIREEEEILYQSPTLFGLLFAARLFGEVDGDDDFAKFRHQTHCGEADQRSIPGMLGAPNSTLPKLLDEYHWVTITRGHRIPTCEELHQWARWASLSEGSPLRATGLPLSRLGDGDERRGLA
jgi:hypothetical protein